MLRSDPGRVMMLKTLILKFLIFVFALTLVGLAEAGPSEIPAERLLSDEELILLLDPDSEPALEPVQRLFEENSEGAMQAFAAHFREAFSERYYFDWKSLDARFGYYRERFPSRRATHQQNADIHQGLYPAEARWLLPYRNLKGNEVTAYELRHLARQHKVLDMAFMHLYEGRNPEYVQYFVGQMRSLNRAFEDREFEDDEGGNGVYESFRAGYRVLNWLQVHAFFLGSPDYSWEDQVELIRTLLHTGAILHQKNTSFRYGNHQTRGVAALAMIAILMRDFRGTDAWYRDAIRILGEHLEKEVNADGFQFERSVHYHIGDIRNYFMVMQLAALNDFPVPDAWRKKLKGMFDAAVVLARPDGKLPVLQDDTDQPWAEFNHMEDFMLLGAVLFDDPEINYFAADSVADSTYWLLRQDQIDSISKLQRQRPSLFSSELPQTGYFVMREGWEKNDAHMVISAGLSEHKPDHQHGDMLGLVARANGQEILPNYQVRYSLQDYEYFKNSLVKNVAMVDGVPHGREWKGNKGGSGFGKWLKLPQPFVIAWVKANDWDFFAGTHDGYEDLGVNYHRSVLFLKGLGWIVRDLFESMTGAHEFQQVWQGHYADEGSGSHHRSAFADGSGLEILQLGDQANSWTSSIRRGKGNIVYSMKGESAAYTTLLYPYRSFSARIPDAFFEEGRWSVNGWTLHVRGAENLRFQDFATDAGLVIENGHTAVLLDAAFLSRGDEPVTIPPHSDLLVDLSSPDRPELVWLGHDEGVIQFTGQRGGINKSPVRPGGRVRLY